MTRSERLCRITVTESQYCVKVENKLSGIFTNNSGVLQEDADFSLLDPLFEVSASVGLKINEIKSNT